MSTKWTLYVLVPVVALLTLTVGCSRTPSDAQITSEVQAKIAADRFSRVSRSACNLRVV